MILQTPELVFLVQTVPSPSSRTGWSLYLWTSQTTNAHFFLNFSFPAFFGCRFWLPTTQFWVSWCWLCNDQPVNVLLFSWTFCIYMCTSFWFTFQVSVFSHGVKDSLVHMDALRLQLEWSPAPYIS
jgi:hypothetical protein